VSSDVTALILAGGKATRLGGIAKHELVIEGETILARQVRVLAPRVSEIVIAAPRDIAGFRTVRDALEGVGPLAGIAAGLAATRTPWLLVVAGDMPYITGELIDAMLAARGDASASRDLFPASSTAEGRSGVSASRDLFPASSTAEGRCGVIDAVCVRARGLPEPLLCVLHARVRGAADRRIAGARYKASELFTDEDLRVAWLDAPDVHTVRNVNRPEDLRE
jgi:molybdopterin-guanine dinucleotide biosynthesis protein A